MNLIGVKAAKSKIGEARIAKIAAAAEKVFVSKHFYATSISDICQEAQIAVGTFYIYFEDKTAIYRYLVQKYKIEIRATLAESIAKAKSRKEVEREGLKAFIRFTHATPHCFDILWGSLAVDKKIFEDYYIDFARSYTRSLENASNELSTRSADTLAYILMGISNFISLRFIIEHNYSEELLSKVVDDELMPMLENGIFAR